MDGGLAADLSSFGGKSIMSSGALHVAHIECLLCLGTQEVEQTRTHTKEPEESTTQADVRTA